MNHFSLEVMGKERVMGLQEEGMRSQAYYRSSTSKNALLGGLPRLISTLFGILIILGLLIR
jgi:hypothetical protein